MTQVKVVHCLKDDVTVPGSNLQMIYVCMYVCMYVYIYIEREKY